MTTFDAFGSAATRVSKAARVWVERLRAIQDAEIGILIDRVPAERISVPAAGFAEKLLSYNKSRIVQFGLSL